MKDTELQCVILKKYYEKRRKGMVELTPKDFNNKFTKEEISRINRQLEEQGLITEVGGYRKITTFGIDDIEKAGIEGDGLKDTEMRRIVLKKYYEKRHEGGKVLLIPAYFNDELSAEFNTEEEISRLSSQLEDHRLIDVEEIGLGRSAVYGAITAFGINDIENE